MLASNFSQRERETIDLPKIMEEWYLKQPTII